MMNRPIDGTLMVARMKRGALGQSVFGDVTVRRADGSQENLGTIAVSSRLRDVMVPGTRGRFYFHDILGSRGLHGFQAVGAPARMAFPRAAEMLFAGFAVLSLLVVFGTMLIDGHLHLLPLLVAITSTVSWAMFAASRQALLHDFRLEVSFAERLLASQRSIA